MFAELRTIHNDNWKLIKEELLAFYETFEEDDPTHFLWLVIRKSMNAGLIEPMGTQAGQAEEVRDTRYCMK